jgi:predicted metal-binding transcription factor (methanogenesis marker protein 9)
MNATKARNSIDALVPKAMLRDLPGWSIAPVPACFGGDPRSLTFCCHPGHALTFADSCQRDDLLEKVGLSKADFVRIKDAFSKAHGWDDERTCFGNLSYCCMRAGGCPGNRDIVLKEKYPGKSWDEVKRAYFSLKKALGLELLKACKNTALVEPFIEIEQAESINKGR